MTATHLRSRGFSVVVSTALIVTFTAVTVVGVMLTASRASAVLTEITETGTPGYISLSRETATPLWSTLRAGDSAHWLIQAALSDSASGQLAIELRGSGDLIEYGGLIGSVEACAGQFDLSSLACSGSPSTAVAPVPLRDLPSTGDRVQLANIEQGAPRELLVTLTLPSDTVIAEGETPSARIGLGVHASGEGDPNVTPIPPVTPRLPVTGADLLPLGLLAAGFIGLGAALAFRRRVIR